MTENKKTTFASDSAVQKSTGKIWKEWFTILDKAGSKKKSHKDIADWIYKTYKISGWWSQMVTVEYEKARGMRKKYQKSEDYEIGVSKTIKAAKNKIYNYWVSDKLKLKWLKDNFEISTKTENKSLRALWLNDYTRISVNFYEKGAD